MLLYLLQILLVLYCLLLSCVLELVDYLIGLELQLGELRFSSLRFGALLFTELLKRLDLLLMLLKHVLSFNLFLLSLSILHGSVILPLLQ